MNQKQSAEPIFCFFLDFPVSISTVPESKTLFAPPFDLRLRCLAQSCHLTLPDVCQQPISSKMHISLTKTTCWLRYCSTA